MFNSFILFVIDFKFADRFDVLINSSFHTRIHRIRQTYSVTLSECFSYYLNNLYYINNQRLGFVEPRQNFDNTLGRTQGKELRGHPSPEKNPVYVTDVTVTGTVGRGVRGQTPLKKKCVRYCQYL